MINYESWLLDGGPPPGSAMPLVDAITRIRRWGGRTVGREYTVAQHSMAVADMMEEDGARPEDVIYGLLHDIEEVATGDIPLPFKTPEQADAGLRLRAKIFRDVFRLPDLKGSRAQLVHAYDRRAAVAEAQVLLSPPQRPTFDPAEVARDEDMGLVLFWHDQDPQTVRTLMLHRIETLMEEPVIRAMGRNL